MNTFSKKAFRRFILGKQGLWPGRRWKGRSGTAKALNEIQAVQMDPLVVVARSHEIALWSRVADFKTEHLDQLLYHDRKFFDYGGCLFIYPMHELPYWRTHMGRRAQDERWYDFATPHHPLVEEVRAELRARGPLGNRDFTRRARVNSYRGRKDSAIALFYLWLTGEVMVHHRNRFERIYDFTENIAPAEYQHIAPAREAENYFTRKGLSFYGALTERGWRGNFADDIRRPVDLPEARCWLAKLKDERKVVQIQVESAKEPLYILYEDLPLLAALEAGSVPKAWTPLNSTTDEECVFLAPLDIVSARSRANWLFDFEYLWEVYKPAHQRRWGYYTLPILFGDQLAARLDPRLNRETMTLEIKGFWLEEKATAKNAAFASALARGLSSFARFLSAEAIDLNSIQPSSLRKQIAKEIQINQK